MYDILDFDANFAAYLEKWMQMNKSKFKNIEQMEDAMPEVYMRWLNSPAAFLEGTAPAMYFEKFSDPQMLVNWVSEYEAAKVPVPDLLLERISDLGKHSLYPLMRAARDKDNSIQTRMTALNLLKEIDCGEEPMEICMDIIDRRQEDDELADVAAELMANMGAGVVKPILDRFEEVSDNAQETYLDILVNYPGDDRIYDLLMSAFISHSDKIALYASFIGKLGDERALDTLKKALNLQEITYLDYLEIRNAVEMLGGVVETEREFAGDPYYESLKGER
ncbi:MAG: hypothetical protein IKJ65_05885 [Clostridia bacterium]|nr:hypothetical protein [Clostridia bacterium]